MPFEPSTIDHSITMTPEQVSAKVAEIAAAANPPLPPGSPADARRRLDTLTKDKAFADRLFGNDAEARREFLELSAKAAEADQVADALAGTAAPRPVFETTISGQLNSRVVGDTIASWRDAGVGDGAIDEALRGHKYSPAEVQATKVFRARRHSDPEWVKRLEAGGVAERREHVLMSIILGPERP